MAFVPTALPSLRRAHPRATCVRMAADDGGSAPVSRAVLRLAAMVGVSVMVTTAGVPPASAFSFPNPFGGRGAEQVEKPVVKAVRAWAVW